MEPSTIGGTDEEAETGSARRIKSLKSLKGLRFEGFEV